MKEMEELTLEPGSDNLYSCLSLDSNADEVDILDSTHPMKVISNIISEFGQHLTFKSQQIWIGGSPVWSSYRELPSQTVLVRISHVPT